MKTRFILATTVSIIFICLYSCTNESSQNILTDLESKKYISAYTQGMIKENASIEFRFVEPQELDKRTLNKSISIKPSINYILEIDSLGKWFKIKPTQSLERGAAYEVILNMKDLVANAGKKQLISNLKVHEQFLSIKREGILIDDKNKSYLHVYVSTAIAEPSENIVSLFDYPKQKIKIESLSPTEYYVDFAFNPTEKLSKIKWEGTAIGSKTKGDLELWNYDKDEFKVVNSSFNRNTRAYKIYFTKLLQENQDSKGLIQLDGKDADHQIKNNVLTVFVKSTVDLDINLKINKGLKAKDKSKLPLDLSYAIEVSVTKPEMQWLSEGTYIPSTGQFKVPFKSKGLKSVIVSVVGIKSENASRYAAWNNMSYMDEMEMIRFGNLVHKSTYSLKDLTSNNLADWNEFGIDMTNAFQREKGTIYHITLAFGPNNTILNCDNKAFDEFEKSTVDASWFENRYRQYNYYRYYDYKEQNNPCHVAYYLERRNISKNIHCTNVFPILKKGENEMHVALKNLLDSSIPSGATVDLISLQGLDLGSCKTSSSGICSFNNLKINPAAIRVTYEGEVSYFNMMDGEENQLTEFDISSNVKDVDNNLFVYTERDVWRPSDTIFMNVMLNRPKFHFENGLPIVVRLRTPKNVLYKKYIANIKEGQSIYTFKMPTHLEALTGYWKAEIEIGPLTTSKSLRVETIKPNVVDLIYNIKGADGDWIYSQKISGEVAVDYLAGYPMKKGKVNAAANIYPVSTPFNKFKKHTFRPLESVNPIQDIELWKVKTNDSGKASFKFAKDFKEMKGVSKLVIDSKIDLPGGGLNTETESHLVSPFSSYVGIAKSTGQGWRGSYQPNETPRIEIIRVNQKGDLLEENAALKYQLFKYQKDWWYDRYRLSRGHQSHNSWRFDKVEDNIIEIKNGKGAFVHNISSNKSGMYKLVVTDPKSGHVAEYQFHSIVSSNYAVQSNPMFIDLQLEKDTYEPNESINLKLPNLKDAKALISIEQGSSVLEMFWYDLDDLELEIPIKSDWFPNVYLHVSIVQNYGQTNNDRPMRMYTVQKIAINQPGNIIDPVIVTNDKIEPNKTFTIEVEEKNGQAMEYTLAIVDRGLLNITGFKTPNPSTHFAKMMALRIRTWDIAQRLIYYMNPSFAGIFSIGGDEAGQKLLDESADFNRFKPVVYHLGPYKLAANKSKKHEISMPNYIGSLKLMVVACNENSFGHADKNIKVVSPLMVQSQLPRSLNVSDKVDVPITFFKDEESIKSATLLASASNNSVTFSTNKTTANFTEGNQALRNLRLITGMESGTTDITFKASSGQYNAIEETKLFINYPNSYSQKQKIHQINAGESLEIPINSFGFEKTKHFDLQISGALVPNFTKQYHDLIQYPYGCLEQTTSKAIAMLHVEDVMDMSPKEKLDNRDFLDAAINKIKSFQQSDGRFNYWNNGYYHNWSDLYAGHFLIDAKDKNLLLNENALTAWLKYSSKQANQWQMRGTVSKYNNHREEVLQAYRLFLLAKAGSPLKSAMNRFHKRTLDSKIANILLAGAYYYSNMESIGKSLLDKGLSMGESDNIYGYSFGSPIRNKSIVVYIMSLFNRSQALDDYYVDWVNEVNNADWLSTQEKGFAFMACKAYYGENQNISEEIDFELKSSLHSIRKKMPSAKQQRYKWSWDKLSDEAIIKNYGSSKIYIYATQRAIDKEMYNDAQQNNLQLKVQYLKANGEALDLNNVTHGEEITIIVQVKNLDILDQENLALTVKAPSGWELLNPRIYTTNADLKANYIYQDFRDDKVYTFFNLNKNGIRTYSFKAKANLTGDYYLPSVRCENMYKGHVNANSKPGRVLIK